MNIFWQDAHLWTASRSKFKRWVIKRRPEKCTLAVIVVSSAKMSTVEFVRCYGMSFTNNKNSAGPKTLPCGTPCLISRVCHYQGIFEVTEITLKKYNNVELASYNTQVAPSLQNKSWNKPLLSRKGKDFYSKEYEINNDNSSNFVKTTKDIKAHFWSSYFVQPKWSRGWEYKQDYKIHWQ